MALIFCFSFILGIGDLLYFAGSNFCHFERLVFLAGNFSILRSHIQLESLNFMQWKYKRKPFKPSSKEMALTRYYIIIMTKWFCIYTFLWCKVLQGKFFMELFGSWKHNRKSATRYIYSTQRTLLLRKTTEKTMIGNHTRLREKWWLVLMRVLLKPKFYTVRMHNTVCVVDIVFSIKAERDKCITAG